MDPLPSEVTEILHRISAGAEDGMARLMPLVYDELRKLAASQLRNERADHTLSPTSLVHEAYLRMLGNNPVEWQDRSHFFGIAALAMRRILVDHARKRLAEKRSRNLEVTLDPAINAAADASSEEILGVDEALERLSALDTRQGKVVELRYFVGLSIDETAEVIGVSIATVKRDWAIARAWLQRELSAA